MNDAPSILDALLPAWESGEPAPPASRGTLDMDEAYRVQVELLRRRRAGGRRHIGWKVGQTNTAMRRERGEDAPAPGFMLADGALDDAAILTLAGGREWFLEPELAVVMGRDLEGGASREAALRAVDHVAPAFELVSRRDGWGDRALLRAVNGSHAGYVLGAPGPSVPDAAGLDDLRIRLERDGELVADVRAGDVNDNPYDTVAWLAGHLAALGERLAAGQVVLAGSYTGLVPIAPGQRWRAEIGSVGSVSLATR